jgi:hypothetical protein
MPNICGTLCSYVCSPCVLVRNLLCGRQAKKVKVDDDGGSGGGGNKNFRDPRFDVEAYADDRRAQHGASRPHTPHPIAGSSAHTVWWTALNTSRRAGVRSLLPTRVCSRVWLLTLFARPPLCLRIVCALLLMRLWRFRRADVCCSAQAILGPLQRR